MISRYALPEMERIWAEENRFEKMLEVEIAVCQAMADLGEIPVEIVLEIKRKAKIDVQRIGEIEKETHHDVIAFLNSITESVGKDASRFIHQGLTSSDVLDTALALQMKESAEKICLDLKKLAVVLKKKALEYKMVPMIGRTHGVHAEPITFGLKLALWYEEILRNLERINRAKKVIAVGKISGAVGTYAHISLQWEELVCKKLGLKIEPVSNQITQRDRHAEFMSAIAITACSLEKFAGEIRSLQRTEILELEEPFMPGQKGSSAMPHKRNPIKCEQICGLARIIRGNLHASLENIALWNERDISHSSVERIILPDSTILIDYLLQKFTWIMEGILVYPRNMLKNINLTGGLIFSQRVFLALVDKGLSRERAYELIQKKAMQAWKKKGDFKSLILKDPEIKKHLNKDEIKKCFNIEWFLRNVDKIFKRINL